MAVPLAGTHPINPFPKKLPEKLFPRLVNLFTPVKLFVPMKELKPVKLFEPVNVWLVLNSATLAESRASATVPVVELRRIEIVQAGTITAEGAGKMIRAVVENHEPRNKCR